jgi:hypothetical protein
MRSTVEEKRDVLAVDVFMLHYSEMESRVFFILFGPVQYIFAWNVPAPSVEE